jgi:hypothetical protein
MLGTHEREASPALAEIDQAVGALLSESRDIARQHRAISRKLNSTMRRSRRLRKESEAQRAEWASLPPRPHARSVTAARSPQPA